MPAVLLPDGTWECSACGRRFTPAPPSPQLAGMARSNAAAHAAVCRGPARPRGRQPNVPAEVVVRIVAERQAGRSLPVIARDLNRDAVPTAQGGRSWYPSTVAAVLRRAAD